MFVFKVRSIHHVNNHVNTRKKVQKYFHLVNRLQSDAGALCKINQDEPHEEQYYKHSIATNSD
jgi:hypothetical protein